MYPKADHIRFVSRVAAKGTGWIQLERPLNYDLRTHWKVNKRTLRQHAQGRAHAGRVESLQGQRRLRGRGDERACRQGAAPSRHASVTRRSPPLPPPIPAPALQIYVYKYQPTVQHSGIESLTVRFAPGAEGWGGVCKGARSAGGGHQQGRHGCAGSRPQTALPSHTKCALRRPPSGRHLPLAPRCLRLQWACHHGRSQLLDQKRALPALLLHPFWASCLSCRAAGAPGHPPARCRKLLQAAAAPLPNGPSYGSFATPRLPTHHALFFSLAAGPRRERRQRRRRQLGGLQRDPWGGAVGGGTQVGVTQPPSAQC